MTKPNYKTASDTERCHIGSLGLHTLNAEKDECIWCGPNRLAWIWGHWERIILEDGSVGGSAWSATPPYEYGPAGTEPPA